MTVLQYKNTVGIYNGGQAVGNHNDGAALCQLLEGRLHPCLVIGVCKGGGFVQNQHRRVFQHGAGNGKPLRFTAGEVDAL